MLLTDLAVIREVLSRHGFSFLKSMGQNFLTDQGVVERMAEASGADLCTGVFEIGPGIGVLTAELAKRARGVACLELDRRLLPVLGETLAEYRNVRIRQGDALKTDLGALVRGFFPDMPVVACASLPYNITTPAVKALIGAGVFRRITVMVQKEAAFRLCAAPGGAGYCELTVLVRHRATPEILFTVPSGCFYPRPSVDSAVVSLDICGKQPACLRDEAFFFRLVHAAFSQRRKTLANALASSLGEAISKRDIENALISRGFDKNIRGEALSASDFAGLSDELRKESAESHPF